MMEQKMVLAKSRAALYRRLALGSAMALVMTFYSTAINFGIGPDFAARWVRSLAMGYAIAAPTAILVSPYVARVVDRLLLQRA